MEQLELRLTQTNNRNTAVRTEKRTIEVIITNISITSINISISITSISILVHTSDHQTKLKRGAADCRSTSGP